MQCLQSSDDQHFENKMLKHPTLLLIAMVQTKKKRCPVESNDPIMNTRCHFSWLFAASNFYRHSWDLSTSKSRINPFKPYGPVYQKKLLPTAKKLNFYQGLPHLLADFPFKKQLPATTAPPNRAFFGAKDIEDPCG